MFDSAIDSVMSDSNLSSFSSIYLTNKQCNNNNNKNFKKANNQQKIEYHHHSNDNDSITSEISMEWF